MPCARRSPPGCGRCRLQIAQGALHAVRGEASGHGHRLLGLLLLLPLLWMQLDGTLLLELANHAAIGLQHLLLRILLR
jgi:hypothetical protein